MRTNGVPKARSSRGSTHSHQSAATVGGNAVICASTCARARAPLSRRGERARVLGSGVGGLWLEARAGGARGARGGVRGRGGRGRWACLLEDGKERGLRAEEEEVERQPRVLLGERHPHLRPPRLARRHKRGGEAQSYPKLWNLSYYSTHPSILEGPFEQIPHGAGKRRRRGEPAHPRRSLFRSAQRTRGRAPCARRARVARGPRRAARPGRHPARRAAPRTRTHTAAAGAGRAPGACAAGGALRARVPAPGRRLMC